MFFSQQRRDEHSKAKSLRIPGVDSHSRLLGRVCGCRSGFRCAGPVCFPWAACAAALWIRVSRASIRIHFLSAPLWDQSLYKASCLLNGSHRLGQQLFLILYFSWQNSRLRNCQSPQKEEEETTEEIPRATGEGRRAQGPDPGGEVSGSFRSREASCSEG